MVRLFKVRLYTRLFILDCEAFDAFGREFIGWAIAVFQATAPINTRSFAIIVKTVTAPFQRSRDIKPFFVPCLSDAQTADTALGKLPATRITGARAVDGM